MQKFVISDLQELQKTSTRR